VRLAAEAAAREPSWGFPQALIAFAKFQQAMSGWWTADVRTAFAETHQAARAALEADDNAWIAHALSGIGELWNNHDHDRALAHLDRAIALNPSASYTYHFLGCVSGFAGRIDDAVAHQSKVFRVDPAYPYSAVVQADLALWSMLSGDMERARQHVNRAVATDPGYTRAVQRLVMFTGLSGDRRAAVKAIGQLARLGTFERSYYDASYPFRDLKHKQLLLEGFRRAGLNLV
jgi:Flp pilus assembly protein TadD